MTAVLTQSGALVLRRLMASPFGRRVYDLVSRTVSFVRAHPYLVLAALTVLIAGEIWLAHARLAPVNLEWAQGWLFFLSIVAWSGMTCLIGVTTPLRWTHPWYVIPLLLVGPPVIIIGALRALYAFTLPDSLSSSFSYPDSFTGSLSYEDTAPYVVAAILFWLVGSILIALATISVKVTKSYAALVIYPLMAVGLAFLSALRFAPLWYMPEMDLDDIVDLVALFYFAQLAVYLAIVLPVLTGISLLRAVFVGRDRNLWLYIQAAFVSLAFTGAMLAFAAFAVGVALAPPAWPFGIALAVPLTILLCTIRHHWRVIAVAATGLWVLTIVIGLYWTDAGAVDYGLDQIASEDRAVAQRMIERGCDTRFNRDGLRVIEEDDGLRLQHYIFWRLPAPC